MLEVINFYKSNIEQSIILEKLKIKKRKYFLISCHREENIDDENNFYKLIESLNNLAEDFKIPIIVSTHPRTQKKFKEKNIKFNNLVTLLKPLGFFDYINLQINSKVVLSDSGTISEESSILDIPAINLRENHERPEAMEEASLIMTGFNYERIKQAIYLLDDQQKSNASFGIVNDYNVENVSKKVIRIIHSYIDFVNKNTWRK